MPHAARRWACRLPCDSGAYLSASEKTPSLIFFLVQSSTFLKSHSTVSICVYHLLQESTGNERAYYVSGSDVLVLAILFGICHLDGRFISHFVSSVRRELGMRSILDKVMRMRHLLDKLKVKQDHRHR